MPSRFFALVLFCFLMLPVHAAEQRSGQQLLQDFGCILCHGITGHRGASAGRPLAPNNHTLTGFLQLVRYPAGNMPAYPGEIITDAQLERIFEYLDKVQEPPAVDEIQSLNELSRVLQESLP